MLAVILNLFIFIVIVAVLYYLQKKYVKFAKRVFIALGAGTLLGICLQWWYGASSSTTTDTLEWISIVGDGYVRLLQMIVMPLIMISILSAIVNLKEGGRDLGRMSGLVIFILVSTAVVAALIGVFTANIFGLSAEGLQMGAGEVARAGYLESKLTDLNNSSFASRIINLIPSNPFLDMTGSRDTSTIGVVIFSAFLGIAALGIVRKKPNSFEVFKNLINSLHDVIMRLVTLVLRLTPYGVLALMTKVVASSSVTDILNLGRFVLASYVALIAMFVVHLLIISGFRLNPMIYLKKVLPVLTFAFTSRSSAGAIPLNIETQTEKLGVQEGIANISASLGASIGQNGCAAIYPAMLAVMIAPVAGVDPMSWTFIIKLLAIIAISSFGVAGVGGGATFAALIVLSSMNFPVGLVGLLISIEPLIDMGRTVLNVNGAMTAGVVTARVMKAFDKKVYYSSAVEDVEDQE
ncbi:MAG TPA: L-cystine transporter [Porphyromonadaceae bacterium]|nr:L-cystine transporter [Porphyromonadaceae bacterium]